MKRKTPFLIPYFFLMIILFSLPSCKKEKTQEEKMTLSVNPEATFIDATPGEYKNFTVTGSSPVLLSRLKITYKKEGGSLNVLLDTLLETKKITLNFPFQIPIYGTQNIYLNIFFDLYDSNGDVVSAAKGINVLYQNYPLTQIVDNELYSRLSGLPSAYNLRSASALTYSIPASEDMNITDSVQVDSLSRSLISPAGGQFVRKNSFDFTNATLTDLRNAYESSAKTTKVSNIVVGDILLYKQTYGIEVFYAVLKITDIQNNAGTSNDKYIFDIKK